MYNPNFYPSEPSQANSIQNKILRLEKALDECRDELSDVSNGDGQYGDRLEQANYRAYIMEKRERLTAEINVLREQSEYLSTTNSSTQTTPSSLS
jgi:hypothetical protein